MYRRTRLLSVLTTIVCTAAHASAGGTPLRVGIGDSHFHDMSPKLIKLAVNPFSEVLRESTGLAGEPIVGGDGFAVAQKLNENKLQLAVFHGFEFPWMQKKYPELRPLLIAVNAQHPTCAYVLVKKDSAARSFADLKGKDIALPERTKEHCRVFLDRECRRAGQAGFKDFFGRVVRPANVETALDELAQGKFPAVLVDAFGLDFYKDLKPGVFAKFRVLAQSELLPPQVIAYRQAGLDDKTIATLRAGLQTVHKTDNGRDMLKDWHITAFLPVPDNFAKVLADSLKAFPAP